MLVESVAAISRRLGMYVLIEGVETVRQMQMIEALGRSPRPGLPVQSRQFPRRRLRLLPADFQIRAA